MERATETGVKFTLPWQQARLGYAQTRTGDLETGVQLLNQARETSEAIHLPYRAALSGVLLGETLASRQPWRVLDIAEGALGIAGQTGFEPRRRGFFESRRRHRPGSIRTLTLPSPQPTRACRLREQSALAPRRATACERLATSARQGAMPMRRTDFTRSHARSTTDWK